MKDEYGYISKAPHDPSSVPKSCWTCLHSMGTVDRSTYCRQSGTDVLRHTIEPCEHYDLNAVWLMVDWFYPAKRRSKA